MHRLIVSIALATIACPVYAELSAPARELQPITDPSMVVMDRGSELEVLAQKRAVAATTGTGRMVAHRVFVAEPGSPISSKQLGVVFNHTMQQEGYISGEIAFQMKSGARLGRPDPSLYPGLKRITKPEVYVVYARTPAEFLDVLKRLQARPDLEWVEPTVVYGAAQ
jgi:hypothetical protein